MVEQQNLVIEVETLQNICVARATGGNADDAEYRRLRQELQSDSRVAALLPRFVITCRDLSQFWSFIKQFAPSYQQRRDYLWEQFAPVLAKLEGQNESPADTHVSETLAAFDVESVHSVWSRALDRRSTDPEGAITSARTLLETVCKHILDESGITYDDTADLPKLYRLTAQQLQLAPDQQQEQVFKQVLGACQSVVEGLGSIRNRLGDAHGKGKAASRAVNRHAQLAVNLAGSMATFLVDSWAAQQPAGSS